MFTFHCPPLIVFFLWDAPRILVGENFTEGDSDTSGFVHVCVQFADSMRPLLNLHLNHQVVT